MDTLQPATDELAGRVAFVTGAARGQGRAIALRLRAAGARIVAGDRRTDELAELADELGDGGLAVTLDVRDAESWAAAVAVTRDEFGGIDVLVNNAGVLRRRPIEHEDALGFEDTWRVNCLGPFLGIRAALPVLRNSDAAAVVNTASTAGRSAWSGYTAYVSSKWAVVGLTRAAAVELAHDGVRVNAVLPGPVATPMLTGSSGPATAADHDRLPSTPIGRIGEANDIAEAVLFLASARSAFMTGAEIVVDGGQTAGFAAPAADHPGLTERA